MVGFRLSVARVLLMTLISFISAAKAEDGPLPLIPKGKGERCVENTDFMRRNHMELLKNQRDETVYKGIRTAQHSLQGCIACHVVPGADNRPVTIANERHFCNVCHLYAAVAPDCFMCHASIPSPPDYFLQKREDSREDRERNKVK